MSQLRGISITTTERPANKPLLGLAGIALSFAISTTIRVIDRNGKGVPNVRITQGSVIAFTDSFGNAVGNFSNTSFTAEKLVGTFVRWRSVHSYPGGILHTIAYTPGYVRF